MNKIKKGIVWLLAVLMVLSSVPITGLAQYDLGANQFIDVKRTPSGKTGEKVTIRMQFNNTEDKDMKGVSIGFNDYTAKAEYEAKEDEDEDIKYSGDIFPFEITSTTFDKNVLGTVKAGSSRSFSLTARVRRDIAEGYYTVPLSVKTRDREYRNEKVNIWITKSTETKKDDEKEGTIQFELGEGQNTPFGTYPNVMNYDMNVHNTSNITAFDVNIRMGLSEDQTKFPFDINDGNYVRHYDRIGGGETISVPYSMMIQEDVYSGYYPITYSIEYRDSSDGDIQKVDKVFYVKVKNKDKEEKNGDFNANDRTKARIIVDSFRTNPETVYAGEEFELILHMKNASQNVTASNILLNLESEKVSDNVIFTMDSGSSSIVMNSLGAGQGKEVRVKLRSGASVDQKTYGLIINEKYDSPEFKNAEEKVTVNIPIKQLPRLNTGNIEVMPESIPVGTESNIMFTINNTGKVMLYNVMVSFKADSIQPIDTYVGNIKPGETGNVDAMISGINPTADDGKILALITYEDENGVVSDPIQKEISLMVTDAEDMADMGDIDFPTDAVPVESSKGIKIIVPSVIGVLVVGTIAVILIRKKRKKKKQELEEEIDDEI